MSEHSCGSSACSSHAPQSQIPPKKKFSAKYIFAVASGKGGVGKSTVAVNTAFTLARKGYKVGLLDADIYGPSLGKMLGFDGPLELEIVAGNKIIPVERFGVKLMSFSFLLEENKAVVWRGPMLGKALEQFLFDIEWGELDYLVVDLPPGTGDVQLSLAQLVDVNGSVIVTTPQKMSLIDAGRAINMFESVNIPILGVVENMSEFVCPHCGGISHIFSQGGGKELAVSNASKILGEVPLVPTLMQAAENGLPMVIDEYKKQLSRENSSDAKTTAAAETIRAAYDHIVEEIQTSLLTQEELAAKA